MPNPPTPVERFIAARRDPTEALDGVLAWVEGGTHPVRSLGGRYRGGEALKLLRDHAAQLEHRAILRTEIVVQRPGLAVEQGVLRARHHGQTVQWRLVIVYRLTSGRLVEADVFVHGDEPFDIVGPRAPAAAGGTPAH